MNSTQELENVYQPYSPGSAQRRRNLIREMAGAGRKSASGSDEGSLRLESSRRADRGWETDSDVLPTFRTAEPEFQINTSALKRAFPAFSQNGSSDAEDSIEIGRGYNRNNQLPSEDISEALPFSIGGNHYRLMGTPPFKPRKIIGNTKANLRILEDKENEDPVKETKNGSRSSNDSRRTLVDRRQTVETDHDDSVVVNDSMPAQPSKASRNTRFGGIREKSNMTTPQRPQQHGTPQNGTAQSFLVPDIQNITELMQSGRRDGTPIMNRSVKSRAKANTPSQLRRVSTATSAHADVPSFPVPAEVKALYASLQLLQEKVAALEEDKEKAEKKSEEQELELLQVKSKLEEYEHARDRDSGLGSEDEQAEGADKTKLESSLKDLQHRLEKAQKKISRSEDQVAALRRERDTLNQRFGVSRLEADEQTNTGRVLVDQVFQLRTQLAELNLEHQRRIRFLSQQELELRGKIERREKAINQMTFLAKELYNTRLALAASESNEVDEMQQDDVRELRRAAKPQRQVSQPAFGVTWENPTTARSRSASRRITSAQSKPHRASNIAVNDNRSNHDGSDAESTTHIRIPRHAPQHELSKNSTFLSFMEGDEVSKLRHVVEDDKSKLAAATGQNEEQFEGGDTGTVHNFTAPRRSSMKKVSYGGFTQHSATEQEPTSTTRDMTEQRTQQSNLSQTSERRRRSDAQKGETTSAFLVEDINLRQQPSGSSVQHIGGEKQRMTIPRPIPVSDRVMETEEIDATLRPAQDPGVALATVIKQLEDEIIQLRTRLSEQQGLYQKHDPALSKRKRKIVFARIQKLLAAIETRSDQIYALYDVLEGQKAKGQMMNDKEVEVTLQTLGIDRNSSRPLAEEVQMDSDSELSLHEESDEEALPTWNGFGDNNTQRLEDLDRLERL